MVAIRSNILQGPGELPQHGFARNTPWKLVNQSIANDVSATFEMATLPAWKNNNYALQLTVTLTSDQRLRTTFVVANKHATESFACQFAFHSYFYLQNDISQMKIEGLQGTTYVDKMQKAQEFPESNSLLGITAETDRVYKAAPNTLYIHDGTDRTIVLSKTIEDAVRQCDTKSLTRVIRWFGTHGLNEARPLPIWVTKNIITLFVWNRVKFQIWPLFLQMALGPAHKTCTSSKMNVFIILSDKSLQVNYSVIVLCLVSAHFACCKVLTPIRKWYISLV